jgi:hypothetical protein
VPQVRAPILEWWQVRHVTNKFSIYSNDGKKWPVRTFRFPIPKELSIASGLFSAESDLVKTNLACPIPIHHVPEGDFLDPHVCERIVYRGILSKNCIRLNTPSLL